MNSKIRYKDRHVAKLTMRFIFLKSKPVLIMKLTTILITFCYLQLSASGYSQTVTVAQDNATLKKVLQLISKQTGYQLLYNAQLLQKANKVTLNAVNAPIEEVLDRIFDSQPLIYDIVDKTIVLKAKVLEKKASVSTALNADIVATGLVTSADKQPIAGANIRVKSTNTTAVTGKDGRFSITVPQSEATLIISYVGYTTKEVAAAKGMTIILEPSINSLSDLVVVGYGSTRRKDLTGSVASVSLAEVKNVPFATVDQALTGKAAGVQVVQADGAPGGVAKIRIRGGTSLMGGNDPLYIIDGVQIQIKNPYIQSAAEIISPIEAFAKDRSDVSVSGNFARGLNNLGGLNINDIETIDILKDASATAIYGSRAANGVVIITTKKGKQSQKPVLEANCYTSVSAAVKEKLLNREQYITIMQEAARNLNAIRATMVPALAPDAVATQMLTNPAYFGTDDTDWMDLVLRNGITQNADISVRGGGTGSRYYTSLAYNSNEGSVIGTDFKRFAGKISLDNDITDKLRINTNLDYGFSTNNITNGIYTQALFAPPTFAPYNPDGSVKFLSPVQDFNAYAFQGFQNPLFFLSGVNRSNTINLIGSIAAEYDILKDLKFRSSLAVNYINYRQTNYVPSTLNIATSSGVGSSNNGMATQAQSQDVNTFYENTLTWNKQFNENNRLTFLFGTSWQISKSNSFSASGQGFPDDIYLNNLSSASLTLPSTGISGQNSLLSFYVRANYTLFEKYLFTFTGRSDASSKFPKNNRVGYFPSGGVAWRISQENFLKDIRWIDEIKLRASAGYTGTQNIADNLFYTLYSPGSYAGLSSLAPTQLGNDKIKWESTLQKDAGIDFSFLNSRLRGGIGYYEKNTSGVLFGAIVANSSGFPGVTANIANIRNRGLELELGGDFINKKNFQWSGSLNISGNRSKVLALSNDFADPANPTVYKYGNTVLKVGEPIGLIYGKVFSGVAKTQADVDAYRKDNLLNVYGAMPYFGIGDATYELVYQAGLRVFKEDVIGKGEPKFYGGYTNNISYKNFTLTTLATFSSGGDIFYLADVQNQDVARRTNKSINILDRWTPENPDAVRPKLVFGQYNLADAGSNNVYDASFIKLKSVTLNYQLPSSLTNRVKISSASIYFTAVNLLTLTSYPGADPEVSNDPYSLIGGYSDAGGYPSVRQFSFGLRFGF